MEPDNALTLEGVLSDVAVRRNGSMAIAALTTEVEVVFPPEVYEMVSASACVAEGARVALQGSIEVSGSMLRFVVSDLSLRG